MTIRKTFRTATPDETLAVLAGIWRRHGAEPFALNLRGPSAPALRLALWRGWVWPTATGSHLTLAGLRALSDHLGHDLIEEWREAERAWAAAGFGFWEIAA